MEPVLWCASTSQPGGCHIPSPDAPLEHIDPDYLQPPTPQPSQISEPQPPQPPPPSAVLWQDAQPSLSLRSFGLRMGERCRLSQVNLDFSAQPVAIRLSVRACTIRRLLHSYLTTGLPGKTVIQGEAILKEVRSMKIITRRPSSWVSSCS